MNKNSVKKLMILWAVVATLQGCGQNKVAPVATQVNEEYLEEASLVEIAPVEECTDEPVVDLHPYDFTLCFAGDIKFDETEENMQYLSSCENGIYDCIDSKLMEEMNAADIMWINNEFTYSTRGNPLEDKAYTFRANPDKVDYMKILGVDIVGLANNHVYDYGMEALEDTFETLEKAGIPYVGAGRNLMEAMRPVYFDVEGKKIAFVAASRAEKNKMTPQATEDSAGILRCYDPTLFIEEIKEADENADFVIALPHWGTEYSTELERVQIDTAREYIDAGADAIVGGHTHCLQGFEFYNDVPIIYSLGNFWFNGKSLDTMLVKLHFFGDDMKEELEVEIVPALQANFTTSYVKEDLQRDFYSRLESISIDVLIDEKGVLHQSDSESD